MPKLRKPPSLFDADSPSVLDSLPKRIGQGIANLLGLNDPQTAVMGMIAPLKGGKFKLGQANIRQDQATFARKSAEILRQSEKNAAGSNMFEALHGLPNRQSVSLKNPGTVRLYRGENPALPGGRNFTTSLEQAKRYGNEIVYVDVPEGYLLENTLPEAMNETVFRLPEDIVSTARRLLDKTQ